ncbi:MAG: TRAP transporter substrate-binding protein DctP [Alphaproteobacteria bacterium]|nr:TRAP transporter substrate-binding protein DctP [Alphaproteobacteria bacterium]
MMRMILPALAIVAFLSSALPAHAGTVKLATMAPRGSPWHEILLDMAAEWEAAAAGGLTVRIYPGGVLGDEPDLMRKMAIGQIDAAMVTTTGLTQLVPEMWVFALPMMIRTYEELDYLRDRIGPDLKAQFRERGFVVLNWGEAGWVRFFSNRRVETPDDLRALRLFVWAGDPVLEDAWRKEAFDIVPLAATDLFSALQSGMVDAYSTTAVASLSFQWFGMAPFMMDLNWAPLVGATIIRLDTWQALPEAVQHKIQIAAEKAGRRFRERTRAFEAEAVKVMQANGLAVTGVSPEAYAQWEKGATGAGEIIRSRYVSQSLAERARRMLTEFRAGLAQSGQNN